MTKRGLIKTILKSVLKPVLKPILKPVLKPILKPVLCMAIALSLVTPTFAQTPLAKPPMAADPYVTYLVRQGILPVSTSTQNNMVAIRTEAFIELLLKALAPSVTDARAVVSQTDAATLVEQAKTIGLVTENDEILQYLNQSLRRELAVQLISRAADIKGDKVVVDPRLSVLFKDFNLVNDINKEAVLKAYQLGIIKGSSDGKFSPKDLVLSNEAYIMTAKLMDKTLRRSITVSKNVSKYTADTMWFIDYFNKQVVSKPVVIEKKKGMIGNKAVTLINDGDKDFTESAFAYNGKWYNWWTDQQFEDECLNYATHVNYDLFTPFTSSIEGPSSPTLGDEKRIGGYYYPYNGEIIFIRHDSDNDGKSRKNYEHIMKNSNRITYDIAKYWAQTAKLKGHNSVVKSNDGSIAFNLDETGSFNDGSMILKIYRYPDVEKTKAGKKFKPDFGMQLLDTHLKEYGPTINQTFIRLYGDDDGLAIYSKVCSIINGQSNRESGKAYYNVRGYQLYLHDETFSSPQIEFTLTKAK